MERKPVKKVVLAYSGGLDTSCIIPWLKENYGNPEVIAFCANLGQEEELDGLEEKAKRTGRCSESQSRKASRTWTVYFSRQPAMSAAG